MKLEMNTMPHGIMFHHFHGSGHIKAQGSIDANELERMLDWYGETHRILPAREFYEKAIREELSPDDTVLTFDDALRCQFDVAYPVLKQRGITAFWFIYTSPLQGVYEKLEIYHHFRFSQFQDIDDFYDAFFEEAEYLAEELGFSVSYKLSDMQYQNYKKASAFYTQNDRKFRYARDVLLGPEKYNQIMDHMLQRANYDLKSNSAKLWINKKIIKSLYEDGNIIGMHSHTHPTCLAEFNNDAQACEYGTCKHILEDILGKDTVTSVSYPCDSYNEFTREIMQELDICIGFRAYMEPSTDPLFIPREDHANIIKEMEKSVER